MPRSDIAVIKHVRHKIKSVWGKKRFFFFFSLLLYIRAIIRHFLLAAFPCGADADAFLCVENRYVVIFLLC